jgi:uncharacterized membrane protein
MEKLMVVVFDSEAKAYEGQRTLMQLDGEGSIAVHARAVVTKNSDGTVSVRQPENLAPVGLVSGSLLGSLIGVLGGPVGWAAGAVTGGLVGALLDLADSGVSADFLDDVSKALVSGKAAVVAEVYEKWVTPVDTRMEQLGGVVFRRTWGEFGKTRKERETAAERAEIAQLEAERAQAGADRQAKLQARIDGLRGKMENALKVAKQRAEAATRERDAKVQALQEKAAQAQGEMKADYENRIAKVRAAYDERVKNLQELAA